MSCVFIKEDFKFSFRESIYSSFNLVMQQLAGCYLMMYQPLWILMQQTGTICNRLELFEQFSKKEHVQFIPAKFGKNLARNLDVL